MPLFEVTLSDGSARIMQAHNKTQLKAALANVRLVEQIRYCKQCRKKAATIQRTLCPSCWEDALTTCRETWKDVPMSEQELKDLAMSFFVDG